MLGSQALETAIGLVLMLFLLATAASAITEIYSTLVKKRSKDLLAALKDMLSTGAATEDDTLKEKIEALISKATGQVNASYLSAKAFADAAAELVAKGENIGPLQDKMQELARQSRGKISEVKAGLETWFDETMRRAQEEYSRWASFVLFGTGLGLAVTLNASLLNVGHDLWRDAAAREAVVEAAGSTTASPPTCKENGDVYEQAQCAVDDISAFQLPLGWGATQRHGMNDEGLAIAWWLSHAVGWLLTAALLMLGANFWFDLLGKLVNLRGTSKRPKEAPDDEGSHSTLVRKNPEADPPSVQRVPTLEAVYTKVGPTERARLEALDDNEMVQAFHDLDPAVFSPPPLSQTEDVDWLATALNLGRPMEAATGSTT